MPNLHLTSASGSKQVDLWQVQKDDEKRAGNIEVGATPSFDSDEAFLSGVTQQQGSELTGKATGIRLSNQSGYSNDPVTALAEWVQKVMSLINGKQGTGFELVHDEREQTLNVGLVNFKWTRTSGAKFEVNWRLTYRIGEGIMVQEDTAPNPANPSSSWSLGGVDLQYPEAYFEEKFSGVVTEPVAFASSPTENLLSTFTGASRKVVISGTYTGTQEKRNEFDRSIRELIGQDNIVTYSSAFPGHELDVMVSSYESTRQAGTTKKGDYFIELFEGKSV